MLRTHWVLWWEQSENFMGTYWERKNNPNTPYPLIKDKQNLGPLGVCCLTSLTPRIFFCPTLLVIFAIFGLGPWLDHELWVYGLSSPSPTRKNMQLRESIYSQVFFTHWCQIQAQILPPKIMWKSFSSTFQKRCQIHEVHAPWNWYFY